MVLCLTFAKCVSMEKSHVFEMRRHISSYECNKVITDILSKVEFSVGNENACKYAQFQL